MSNLLIGEYEHTLDEKKRVSLPKQFRASLGRRVVMTRGLDNCLVIYSPKAWEKMAEKLQSLSIVNADTRGFSRFLLSGAAEVEVDGVGRILVPDHQKEYAGLKKRIIFAGVSDRVEVWDADRWSTYKNHIDKDAERMAKKLGEIGAL
ncbi:MAG TPA: division/cell wall cluster transcriptional repressor MraZ [Candidatus Paceibacterota bacterium]